MSELLSSPFFGLALTVGCWSFGVWLQKRTGLIICNPLLVAVALIIPILLIFRIPYAAYDAGASLIRLMLGPVTAVLALKVYHQRAVLKEHFLPVLAGCFVGSLSSILLVVGLCHLMTVDQTLAASLLPKSVTTAIAIGIAESRGGVGGITAAAVMVAGLTGAVFSPLFARVLRVEDPVAQGLAIGAASHALGTTKAMELGPIQGAMSSISLCVCGIMTSVLTLFF